MLESNLLNINSYIIYFLWLESNNTTYILYIVIFLEAYIHDHYQTPGTSLRTGTITDMTAWLMSTWSFSPYSADWWECSVDFKGNSTFILTMKWAGVANKRRPCIKTQSEMARDFSLHPHIKSLQWSMPAYVVSWTSWLVMLFLEHLFFYTK